MKDSTRWWCVAGTAAAAGGGTSLALCRTRLHPAAKVLLSALAFGAPFAVDALLRRAKATCTLIYVSDTHGSAASNARLAAALRAEPGVDAFLHGGDVADAADLYRPWWDNIFASVGTWWVAEGNHDAITESREAFRSRFGSLPRVERCGNVEVYILPWRIDNSVGRWAREQLEQSTARWRILVAHHPFWSAAAGGWESEYTVMCRNRLEDVLAQMDLVLVGHDHVYWDSTHDLDGVQVRQILLHSGPKHYDCDYRAEGCEERTRDYLRITASESKLVVERKTLP